MWRSLPLDLWDDSQMITVLFNKNKYTYGDSKRIVTIETGPGNTEHQITVSGFYGLLAELPKESSGLMHHTLLQVDLYTHHQESLPVPSQPLPQTAFPVRGNTDSVNPHSSSILIVLCVCLPVEVLTCLGKWASVLCLMGMDANHLQETGPILWRQHSWYGN